MAYTPSSQSSLANNEQLNDDMSANPSFEKVGECLYRNPASGTYFARVKVRGKEIKQTLKIKHLATAGGN